MMCIRRRNCDRAKVYKVFYQFCTEYIHEIFIYKKKYCRKIAFLSGLEDYIYFILNKKITQISLFCQQEVVY